MVDSIEKIAFIASDTPEAQRAADELIYLYGNCSLEKAQIIVALGGDGFMLQTLHNTMNTNKQVYGMNRGSVGFLMNEFHTNGLKERLFNATENAIHPLQMKVTCEKGKTTTALAINEVSLFRQSYQAAKLKVSVDGKVRLRELVCDGVMVATPAGSTAYNLSAHGPILPLESPLFALTPVSPFRPRRWRGALLPNHCSVEFDVLEPEKRPVNAVADHTEVKSVRKIQITEACDKTARILFDPDHSWSDRILAEQFQY